MKRFARTSWDALRKFAEERLADITHEFWFDWPRFLRWSGFIALVLVATMHLVQATTIRRGDALGLAVVVGASLIASALLALQGWALWQTHLDATERRPYVVAVLLLAVTVSVCTEAFAGVTLWLASNGLVMAHGTTPSLWTAERVYLWHLVDSVPVLSITQTLGWARPLVFSGAASGALVLLFKITLILPLVRLAIAGYELVASANDAAIERAGERQRRGQSSGFPHDEDLLVLACFLFVATAVIAVGVFFVFEPASAMNRWLATHLAPGISVGRVHIPTSWLQTAPQWVGTIALTYFTLLTADFVSVESNTTFHSLSKVLGGVWSYLAILCLLTLIGVAATLTLLHVGLVRTQMEIPPHAQVWAAIDAYTRSLADAIPGLEVPERLEWTLAYPFVGIVSGVLLVLHKLACVVVLLVPITRIMRSFVRRLRPRAIVPLLPASGEFMALLRTTQTKLDELERITLAKPDRRERWRASRPKRPDAVAAPDAPSARTGVAQLDADRAPRPLTASPDTPTLLRDWRLGPRGGPPPVTLYDIDRLIVQLEDAFARVTALFGEGEIWRCADGALAAVLRSRDRLRALGWDRSSSRGESIADALSKARADLEEKTESFSELAAEALAQQQSVAKPAMKD